MDIKLNIGDIIKDVRTKSHFEVANVQDQTARYKIEAGTEKLGEVKRDLAAAVSTLIQECYRFLDAPGIDEADNSLTDAEELTIIVEGGPRRLYGKEKALAQKLHEIAVDLTLHKFYASVSQADLSKQHASLAATGIATLESMLRQKRPPKYLDR